MRSQRLPYLSVEYGHGAVLFLSGFLPKLDTPAHVGPVVAPEIIRRQKQEDTRPPDWFPIAATWRSPFALGQKKTRAGAGRNQDPSLLF